MAILPIITAPDPRLKLVCAPVERVDDDVRRLMDDMLETIHQAPGIGLAAPQMGITRRVIVVDIGGEDGEYDPHGMVNPEILWASEALFDYEEGCLSLPDQFALVGRPDEIRVRYLDRAGETRELEAEGILATCIQHEMDHLDGILFVDHLSKLKRSLILRRLLKARKQKVAVGA